MYKKDGLRIIERLIFQNPELDIDDFPPLDAYDIECQEMEAFVYDYEMCSKYVHAYVREYEKEDGTGSWFVDIYFYLVNRRNQIERRRFVIAPGYQMSSECEWEFLRYINSEYISYNLRTCGNFVNKMNKLDEGIHLKAYRDFGMILEHVYFTSFSSGFRELLWKAGGLEHIAMNIHLIDDFNFVGNDVEDMLDVPIKMLRKLNSIDNIESVIKTEPGRKQVKKLYHRFHSILNNYKKLNQFQLRYLAESYETRNEKIKIDNKLFQILGGIQSGYDSEGEEYIDGNVLYYQFLEYIKLVEEVKIYSHIFPRYPSLTIENENAQRFKEKYCFLKYYLEHENIVNETFVELSKKWSNLYFEDEKYLIMPPANVNDLLLEAHMQFNCLVDYVTQIMDEETIIVFMREKENPNKSLITIEVRNNRITQALLACNKTISNESQLHFLCKYANEKGLVAMF